MKKRFTPATIMTFFVIGLGLVGLNIIHADERVIPRTPDGKPDLQGVWANNSATPLERPEALADKESLSDEEVASLQQTADTLFNGETDAAFGDEIFNAALAAEDDHESYDPDTGNYNHFWVEKRDFDNRTSLVVDPANGRLPEATEEGKARVMARAKHVREHPADSYTDRSNSDRCISYGVPFLQAGYNGYFQIVQNSDHVLILQEMIHEARIVPLDGRPHLDGISQYTGDTRGRWEGDTLVLETKNFSPKIHFRAGRGEGAGISHENLNLTERYSLIDSDTLQWALTISDPTTWSADWTAVVRMKRSAEPIFEYACHEGNYSMEGILAGHREQEAAVGGGAGE